MFLCTIINVSNYLTALQDYMDERRRSLELCIKIFGSVTTSNTIFRNPWTFRILVGFIVYMYRKVLRYKKYFERIPGFYVCDYHFFFSKNIYFNKTSLICKIYKFQYRSFITIVKL